MKYDYLIVGQGLAGTVLAQTFLEAGLNIFVVDNSPAHSTSKVAAGLFNPVTGSDLKLSWLSAEIFPFLFEFYPRLEAKLGVQFFCPMPLYRPFESIEQQNDVFGKSAEFPFEMFVKKIHTQAIAEDIHNPFGGVELQWCGFVRTTLLIEAFQKYLSDNQIFRKENFDYSDLEIAQNEVSWKGITAKKIIFCEGEAARRNPFFADLPFRPVKGEILDLKIEKADFQMILNKGVWLIPQGNGFYRCGSNYDWANLDDVPTQKIKEEISEKLSNLIPYSFDIEGHKAAVRPASHDRKPFLGQHHQYNNLFIFNGMGTKGTSLAPYFANHLLDYLENGKALMKDVDIQRVYKKNRKGKDA